MQAQGAELEGLPALYGEQAANVIPYSRDQGGKTFHYLAFPTNYLQGGPIGRQYSEHHLSPYSNLRSSPINIPNPCIQICIKRKLSMFTFTYYMYDKSLKDKVSQLTLYVVPPLHLTYQVSYKMTNISLPPSSSSFFLL